jgi:hypothetical protein
MRRASFRGFDSAVDPELRPRMTEGWRSELAGTAVLWALVAVAVALTVVRRPVATDEQRVSLVKLFAIGVAAQCLHLLEEYLTGFYVRWPEFIGFARWTQEFFITFNLCWIAIWVASAAGVLTGLRIAYVPVWFFTLGMIGNAIWHPLLALATGAYFPGLWTSPIGGLIGLLLIYRLVRSTTVG